MAQLSFFSKFTAISYPCPGTDKCYDILAAVDSRLITVKSVKSARRNKFDGVILTGGSDLNPFFYGENSTHSRPADRLRDTVEWTLVRRALNEGKPIFGICRGMQILNVACGGSLHQDIKRDRVSKFNHTGPNHKITAYGLLKDILPSDMVNSRHHQAIDSVAYGFQVVARSEPDRIVEAIYRPGYLGIQWHPEDLYYQDDRWYRLFDWFVKGFN